MRELLIPRLLRALRANPHGIEGPLVIQYLTTVLAKSERGWGPDDLEDVPLHDLLEWTRAIYLFLMSLSLDLREREPELSADATWALAQVGLTAERLHDAQEWEFEGLASLAWEDEAPPSNSPAACP